MIVLPLGACSEIAVEEKKEFSLNENYRIVRSEEMESNADILSAMRTLSDAVNISYGYDLAFSDDWVKKDAPVVPAEYEILIGKTNREESKEFLADLKIGDYGYYIKNENVIVIGGGSTKATLKAVEAFCADILGYDGNGGTWQPELTAGTSFIYHARRGEHSDAEVMICGEPLESFTVAIPSAAYYDTAFALVEKLAEYNGYAIPIKTYSALNNEDKNIICLGSSKRNGMRDASLSGYEAALTVGHDKEGVVIGLATATNDAISAYIDRFTEPFKISASARSVKLELDEGTRKMFYSFDGTVPVWTLKESSEETLCDGVTYEERYYTDESGLPYRAYVLYVDPAKAYLYMGTSQDGYELDITDLPKMNVAGHINAAAANGIHAVAGVNGDFYHIATDFSPEGLTVKEGTLINGDNGRVWMGYTYDGKMVIAPAADFKKYEGSLRTAVGGSHIILQNGKLSNLDTASDFSTTSHPRTLAGYRSDGTMILAVIDGRQKSISNGAPLANCALFMRSLGAEYAVNLDGGGSSTMITKRGEELVTENSPSDGRLRGIYNSILIVPNK